MSGQGVIINKKRHSNSGVPSLRMTDKKASNLNDFFKKHNSKKQSTKKKESKPDEEAA